MSVKNPLKKQKTTPKLNENKSDIISFSFEKITSEKEYNFECFDRKGKNGGEIAKAFFQKLVSLSNLSAINFFAAHKKTMWEVMTARNFLATRFVKSLNLGVDENIYITRFGSQKYRFAFLRHPKDKNILQIIGIDIDLSWYDHGS